MTLVRSRPGRRVPTLTEVIVPPTIVDLPLDVANGDIDVDIGAIGDTKAQTDALAFPELRKPFNKRTIPSISALLASIEAEASAEETLVAHAITRVMAEVQQQFDATLEARLREVLAPALARATDTIVRETREQFAATLRDTVARAVAQELARHRHR
ncbi:MAG: hypothetical protein WA210_17590 [Burkholderiaceae bacterium]